MTSGARSGAMGPVPTQAQIDELIDRIASGLKELEYESTAGRRRKKLQDIEQMQAVLEKWQAEVNPIQIFRRATHSKGFRR